MSGGRLGRRMTALSCTGKGTLLYDSAMTTPFVNQFRESLRFIKENGATLQGVADMMMKCRKLLEDTGSKTSYRTANLFGNWIVHPELERHGNILEEINDFLAQLLRGDGGGPFGPEVSKKFRLDDLRSDLLAICRLHSIPDDPLVDDESWHRIRDRILEQVCEAKLVADNKEVQRLSSLHPKDPFVVSSVLITKDPSILKNFEKPASFAFVIDLSEMANLSAAPRRIISQIRF
jgi:hypothetical protein